MIEILIVGRYIMSNFCKKFKKIIKICMIRVNRSNTPLHSREAPEDSGMIKTPFSFRISDVDHSRLLGHRLAISTCLLAISKGLIFSSAFIEPHLSQEILVERVVKFVEAYYSLESKKKSHSSSKRSTNLSCLILNLQSSLSY